MSGQKPKASRETQEPADQENHEHTEPNESTPAASAEVKNVKPEPEHHQPHNQQRHWLDYAAAIFALIAAIGGLIAGAAGSYQGWVSRDSEIVANRAYIVLNSAELVSYDTPNKDGRQWVISPNIENTGNTPTKTLRYANGIGYCAPGVANVKSYFDKLFDWDAATNGHFLNNVIGPKSSAPTGFITIQEVKFDCGFEVVIPGIAKYTDIFDAPHLLEFCTLFKFPSIDFRNYPSGQRIRVPGFACQNHNCNDEQCGSDWRKRALD